MKIKYNSKLKETLYTQSERWVNLDNGSWLIPPEGGPVWLHWVYVHGVWFYSFSQRGGFTDVTDEVSAKLSPCTRFGGFSFIPLKSSLLEYTCSNLLSCQSWMEHRKCCVVSRNPGYDPRVGSFDPWLQNMGLDSDRRGLKIRADTYGPKFICQFKCPGFYQIFVPSFKQWHGFHW